MREKETLYRALGCSCEFHVAIPDVEHSHPTYLASKWSLLFLFRYSREVFCLPVLFRRSLEVRWRVRLSGQSLSRFDRQLSSVEPGSRRAGLLRNQNRSY